MKARSVPPFWVTSYCEGRQPLPQLVVGGELGSSVMAPVCRASRVTVASAARGAPTTGPHRRGGDVLDRLQGAEGVGAVGPALQRDDEAARALALDGDEGLEDGAGPVDVGDVADAVAGLERCATNASSGGSGEADGVAVEHLDGGPSSGAGAGRRGTGGGGGRRTVPSRRSRWARTRVA